jgi:hypothetical protein
MTNYMPVSLLTAFSEVLGKVLYNSLRHYLQENTILVPEGFGFRKGISTENVASKPIVY